MNLLSMSDRAWRSVHSGKAIGLKRETCGGLGSLTMKNFEKITCNIWICEFRCISSKASCWICMEMGSHHSQCGVVGFYPTPKKVSSKPFRTDC